MATCAQKEAWLAEAETALHKLQTGSKVETVVDGENRLTYTAANVAKLEAYVARLTDQVAACTGSSSPRRRVFGIIPTDANS